jgi:hypothetical protein
MAQGDQSADGDNHGRKRDAEAQHGGDGEIDLLV